MSTAIQISNLSKIYRLGEMGTGTMSRDLERWFKMRIRGQEDPYLKIGESNDRSKKGESDLVYSLKDINFEVKQGDALGIIGKNGAGKSTLLKILSQVTSPTTGRIDIKGRIASLLEVGTGFHPELTGRENIYLNGAILGMRKREITRKLDEIIEFSGVERYIDTPVKRYSSGMYVRLAFAVAAHLESEILIVDEVLAVGDAEFQKKCLGKMGAISKGEGRTVLFVSHNMGAVQSLCTSGILLYNGMVEKMGSANEVVQYYFSMGINNKERLPIERYRNNSIKAAPVYITDIYVKGSQNEVPTLPMDAPPVIIVKIFAREEIKNANITIKFYNSEGISTDLAFSWDDNFYLNAEAGFNEIEFSQSYFSLSPGKYTIEAGLNQSLNTAGWDGISYYPIFEIENQNSVVHWNSRPWAIHHSKNNNWNCMPVKE